jgi:hypothetical protein
VNVSFAFWSFCGVCTLFILLPTAANRMESIFYQWVIAESTRQVTPQDRAVDIELEGAMSHDSQLGLAMVRNNLYNGRFAEPDDETLRQITAEIEGSDTPFRELMLVSIANARADIAARLFREAGNEIDAIHNLPVRAHEFAEWDANWFQVGTLPGYIESAPASRAEAFSRLATDAMSSLKGSPSNNSLERTRKG